MPPDQTVDAGHRGDRGDRPAGADHQRPGFQGSLLDLEDDLGLRSLGVAVRRTTLAHGAWVDLRPGWVTGSEQLFEVLRRAVDWRSERRRMYERVVDTPRLLRFFGAGESLPHPFVAQARDALSGHYAAQVGEPFTSVGMCLYRDGRDSVAWHGDTIGRGATQDTVVAIVSLGTPRPLLLRPRRDGASSVYATPPTPVPSPPLAPATPVPGVGPLRFLVGHGDLLVMGGSCQRTWEHTIPKLTASTGPRISLQYRPHGVA